MDQIIHFVFFSEELCADAGAASALWLGHAPVKRDYVSAGTERLIAFGFDPHGTNAIILSPAFELWRQHPNHLERERVECLGRI